MTRQQFQNMLAKLPTHLVLIALMAIWLIPTIGLLVTSLRPLQLVNSTGWWTALAPPQGSQEFATHCQECHGADGKAIANADLTDPELVGSYSRSVKLMALFNGEKHPPLTSPLPENNQDKAQVAADIAAYMKQISGILVVPRFTLGNYVDALLGYRGTTNYADACAQGGDAALGLNCDASDILNPRGMGRAFLNSLIVAIPSTILPILIAAFAAYAFAWLDFRGRNLLFAVLVGLQVIPLQMTLVPISRVYNSLGLTGSFLAVWLFHTGFGLPYAIYLMRNFLGGLPRDLFESAYLDGADHWTAFTRLALPLAMPAIASLAIFQFLWIWNDLLVALVFLGSKNPVLTYQIGNMVSSHGSGWHLLTAAAFISMILPMLVFFAMQRYFVRGLLAGAVKG